ncbi:hypothetical protein [Tepidibacter formicigenes]|jgi:hypothetical protein|uniref:DUF2933 domain-containing protein n=1 Tax=Tepidibacter formicigenes DSM 15518 TaxID=1123349 RepID=A0A1M6LL22_9FIRM|nr:hypothetical protein [Tepidibacter formicigenes]SHJ71858.1 hypothetical protein SAMN02744037_00674 [Tepidibacter formicigenes DSM 15518]
MNCSKNNHDKNNKGLLKHGILMMLCCMLPILIIAGLPLFGIKGGILSSLVFLLCPLMHVGMIVIMKKSHNNKDCYEIENEKYVEIEEKEYKVIEDK